MLGGSYAAALNNTIIGVAVPDIAAELDGGAFEVDVDWVIVAYLIGVVVIQPATGWLADAYGRTRTYVTCLGVFGAAAALCSMAPTLPVLVAGRLVQGLGGGALMPVGMTIALEQFPPHRRGMAIGVWGVGIAGAPAAGPPLGGWLVTAAGWRWLFAAFTGVALLACVLAASLLRDSEPRQRRPLDRAGWALAAIAFIGAVVVSRQGASWGYSSGQFLGTVAVAGGSGAAFVLRSRRRPDAIIELAMFRTPTFAIAVVVSSLLAVAQFARYNFLPIELQIVRGLDAFEVGVLLAPAALGLAIAMPIGGWLTDRAGARIPTLIGLVTVTWTMWILGHISDDISEREIVVVLVLQGVGTGLSFVPTTVAAVNSLPGRLTAQASAVKTLDRQFAGAIGVAALGAVLTANLGAVSPTAADPRVAQAAFNEIFMLAFWVALAATALGVFMPGRALTRAHHANRNQDLGS